MIEQQGDDRRWITSAVERLRQQQLQSQAHELPETTKLGQRGEAKLRGLGLSSRHVRLLLAPEKILETTALAAARAFCGNRDAWCLCLLGSHGAGKTFAAEWALAAILQAGSVTGDGQSRLLGPYELRDAAYDPLARQKLKKQGALVLDDLGAEGRDRLEVLCGVLFELIDYRWRHEKRTVITSNLSPRSFRERYGRGITERILHGGRCVSVSGPDLRTGDKNSCRPLPL